MGTNSESNVGTRLTILGRAAFLAGMREATAAVADYNKTVAAGAAASAEAAAGQDAFYAAGSKSLAQYKAEQEAATAAQSASVVALGKRATFALGAAAVAITYEGLKIHSSFQSAMTRVSTLAGVNQGRLAELTAGIKALSPQVDQGLTPLANALYRIASTPAGLKATNAQLLTMTKYAGMLTTIGGPGTTLTQTSRIIGGAMSTGIKGAGSPKNIVSLAAATVGSGDIKMSDFVNFMGTGVLTSGKLTGVTMPQVAAFLALAGSNLQSGQVSGHGLAHGLQLMAAPTPTAQNALGAIGLGATTLAHVMRTKGLGAAVKTLYAHLQAPLRHEGDPNSPGLSTTLTKYGFTPKQIAQAQSVGMGKMATGKTLQNLLLTRMFGGAKMGIPLDMLVTESKNYTATLARMKKTGDNFSKAWGQQTDTLAFKTGAFEKSLANLADTIGTTLTPVAKGFLTVGTAFFGFLGRNRWAAIALATVVTGVLGPAIGVYLKAKFAEAGGALASVIRGYANLVRAILQRFIPSLRAEDAALATNDASLTANEADVVADDAVASRGAAARLGLGGAADAAGDAGFLGALGAGTGGAATLGTVGAVALPVAATVAGLMYLNGGFNNSGKTPQLGLEGIPRRAIRTFGHLKHLPKHISLPKDLDQLTSSKLVTELSRTTPSAAAQVKAALTGQTSVYIDGKPVFTAVQKQAKKKAARN